MQQEDGIPSSFSGSHQSDAPLEQKQTEQLNDGGDAHCVQDDTVSGNPNLTEKQKKLFELRLKMVMQLFMYTMFMMFDIYELLPPKYLLGLQCCVCRMKQGRPIRWRW